MRTISLGGGLFAIALCFASWAAGAPPQTIMQEDIEVLRKEIAQLWQDEFGIVHISYVPNADVLMADAVRNIEIIAELAQGRKVPVLTDIRNMKTVGRDVRQYSTGPEAQAVVAAVGAIVASPVSRMLGTIWLKIDKPPFPTRLFTSESQALAWLRQFS